MKIAVLGAGAWGTAIAITLSQRHGVALWSRDRAQCDAMRSARVNDKYLPGLAFPSTLEIADGLDEALQGAELALVAVPTAALRGVLERASQVSAGVRVIWLCKGFEPGRGRRPHEVCAEALGELRDCGVLSGPSFAEEVARGLP